LRPGSRIAAGDVEAIAGVRVDDPAVVAHPLPLPG
jgi:hypothetical protein